MSRYDCLCSIPNPSGITFHLFDSRSTNALDRSLFAVHFPVSRTLTVYTLARIPADDTLRLYPPVKQIEATSAVAVSAFRNPSLLDLVWVRKDGSLSALMHGTKEVKLDVEGLEAQGEDGDMSVDSDTSLIDTHKITHLSSPLYSSFIMHFSNGTSSFTNFNSAIPNDLLTRMAFRTLSFALSVERACDLQIRWLWHRREHCVSEDREWVCFCNALCELLHVESPHRAIEPIHDSRFSSLGPPSSYAHLLDDPVLDFLDIPFVPYPTFTAPPPKPHADVDPCLLALHLLAESYKLKVNCIGALLPRLSKLLIALARSTRPEWADYWVRMFPENPEGWADPKRDSQSFTCL